MRRLTGIALQIALWKLTCQHASVQESAGVRGTLSTLATATSIISLLSCCIETRTCTAAASGPIDCCKADSFDLWLGSGQQSGVPTAARKRTHHLPLHYVRYYYGDHNSNNSNHHHQPLGSAMHYRIYPASYHQRCTEHRGKPVRR